jgi:hypothetical protein
MTVDEALDMPCPTCGKPLGDRQKPLGPQLGGLSLVVHDVHGVPRPVLVHLWCLSQWGDFYVFDKDGHLRRQW